jgi:TRAP-type mannitol/chloroaromatic compound transport system permease small subunit
MLRRLLASIDATNDWLGKIASFIVLPLIAVIIYEVVLRYVFNDPTIWVHETSALLYGGLLMLGGAYTLRHRGHVNIDILYNRLSPRWQAILDIVTSFVFFLFCVALIWKGAEFAQASWRVLETSSTSFRAPLFPSKTLIPIGGSLLLLQGLAKFIRDTITIVKGRQPT